VDATAAGIQITAGAARYTARQVVVAVGPWLGAFLPGLRLPLQVERQVSVWCPVADPALYAPARCPVYMHETRPGHYCYGFPTLDGATIKLGIHHEGAITTARAVDRAVHPADLAPVEEFARDYLTGVEPTSARGKVCLYTNTPDGHFLVGPAPGLPGVTVMGGFSGHGFKFAPVLGVAVADLLLTGATTYPIDLFAPARFAAD
jgi:sarcosine oxidase